MGGIESVRAATDTPQRVLEYETSAAFALRFEKDALGTASAAIATMGGTGPSDIYGTEGSVTLSGVDLVIFETADSEEDRGILKQGPGTVI